MPLQSVLNHEMTQDPVKNKAPGGEVTLRTKGFAEGPPGRSMDKKGLFSYLLLVCAGNPQPRGGHSEPSPPLKGM